MRRRKRNKQRKIIILTSLSLLFILTVGYAAFQTNLNITAKGNIIEKGITIQELKDKYCSQTSGDGLYKDMYEDGRCVYRGANPDNYITFNDEFWRIISAEADGTLKIMKKDNIGSLIFDSANIRTTEYCNYNQYGCNVWGSVSTMLDQFGKNVTTMKREFNELKSYQLPTSESQMAIYLNETYYIELSDVSKGVIDNHLWNVGPLDIGDKSLENSIQEENEYKWRGKIGLINATDYVKASTYASCTNIYNGSWQNQLYPCKNNNYLFIATPYWTISPVSRSYAYTIWSVGSTGTLYRTDANYDITVHPALYLKKDVLLKGKGTKENPYKIVSY